MSHHVFEPCKHGIPTDNPCSQCDEQHKGYAVATPPQTPSELDKAVEAMESSTIYALHQPNCKCPRCVVLSAAKRLKEVEKENQSLNGDLDHILTDKDYEGEVQYWIAKHDTRLEELGRLLEINAKQQQDLSTLRTEYKNALVELIAIFVDHNEPDGSPDEKFKVCECSQCARINKILSTPHAIAAMKKGEV